MTRSFTTRPEIRGTFGAVASTHWIASAVGFGILERGGNAFAAAVATGFTLQIVEPHLNGPGGEVPIIVHPAGAGRPRVLCGQGVAPRAATIARLREMGVTRMPGTGLVPAVVPGAFGAWMQLLLEHGTMRLRDVLAPAIGYARDSWPLVRRAALVGDTASLDLRPGERPGQPVHDGASRRAILTALAATPADAGPGGGEPTFADLPEVEGDTVQLDVADRWGNLVAATPSGGWLQGSPAVPGLGFNVTTRGQMFWLDERLPSHLAPGRRPRTTLTPTVLTRDGRPVAGLGSPGGDQQDQWTLGLLLRHLHQGLNLQAAIDAPLFHTTHYMGSFAPRAFTPGVVHVEERFPEAVREELAERGHLLEVQPPWSLGRLCAAGFTRTGLVRAAATPRFMQAYAVGR